MYGYLLSAVIAVAVAYMVLLTPVVVYGAMLVASLLLGTMLAVFQGSFTRRRRVTYPPSPPCNQKVDRTLSRLKIYPPHVSRPPLLSRRVDAYLQQVIDLVVEHHLSPVYSRIGWNQDDLVRCIMPDLWTTLASLVERVARIDTIKLFTQDTVEALRVHFEHFREVHFQDPLHAPSKFPVLESFPYLENIGKELNFLRQASEVLLCACLPREVLTCSPARVLIREHLTCHILQPTIERLCEPDYINQKLLVYLTQREDTMKSAQKKYSYSATYEDFMQHMKKCDDIAELQQIRQFIITDIIQAKAVQRMKNSRATGIHGGNFPIPIPADKVKILMGRNLELYATQLGTAKMCCERQIRKLGGQDYESTGASSEGCAENALSLSIPPAIPFDTIMTNTTAQERFREFLEHCQFSHFLHYWLSVEALKSCPTQCTVECAREFHELYFSPTAKSCLFIDEHFVQAVLDASREEEILAALINIQEWVYNELREDFYPGFVQSESYANFMQSENSAPLADSHDGIEEDHYQQLLQSLKSQLKEKGDALINTPHSVRSDEHKRALMEEHTSLEQEIKNLEHYIEHTEEWFRTIGQWNIEIQSVDLSKEDQNHKDPLFVIVIHRPDESMLTEPGRNSVCDCSSLQEGDQLGKGQNREGWVVGRKFSEFEQLHLKLSEMYGSLQFPTLPNRLMPFQKPERYWTKLRKLLEDYLTALLSDAKLCECEEVFNFLSPASEHLRRTSTVKPGKARSHLYVPGFPGMATVAGLFSKDREEESPIAEYMYTLISEVFELDEWSRVLRKQLMDLVQLTYGKSIDREVQEFSNWIVSEPMLVFYLTTFKEAMWPSGKLPSTTPTRSDEEKAHTKDCAKNKFLKSVPTALQTILGQQNCQIGFQKIFDSLQDFKANKQLFYSVFEKILFTLVPEIE